MHPRKFVRDSLGFAATQYVIRALLLVRGIVAARLLAPFQLGAWSAIQLLMDYGIFAPLGTQQGLDQAVPGRIVEGDPARLDRLKRAGLFNVLALSLGFITLCLGYMLVKPSRIMGSWGPGGVALALLCVVLTNFALYHMTLLRSHGNITAVSGWFFLQGVIGTVMGLALIPSLGMWGLLIGWAVATLVATVFIRLQGRGRVPLLPRPAPEGRLLVRIGFPMYVFMAATLVTRSLDRLIVFKFLGSGQLGIYTLAVMALTFLLYLPDSIAYVLYPRLLQDYRAADNDPDSIRPTVERALGGLAVIVPVLGGIAYLCAHDSVLFLLKPDYWSGVTAIRTLCFGACTMAFVSVSSFVLMTLGRQDLLIPTAIGTVALGLGLDSLALWLHTGINGVARATFCTYFANGVLLLWLALGGLRIPIGRRLATLARLYLPLLVSLGLAWGIDRLLPWSADLSRAVRLLRMLAATLLFLALYGAAVLPFTRGLGLRRLVLEFNLPIPFVGRRAAAPRS